jgi:hypothetical protein
MARRNVFAFSRVLGFKCKTHRKKLKIRAGLLCGTFIIVGYVNV